ncbi:DUF2752 domain-containing protein [Emticicia sp. SJ17W-69]|uniref:DUF2752 domain-containing protein n=1 Tax=Emticicia sp. SJ17W-69 TaxID=3421657 RepID=UPI003EBAC400
MNISKTYYKILLAVVALAITAYYFFSNPTESNLGFPCLFNKTTGLYCPGCGGQRAFHYLLHGDFALAFQNNLLIFFVLPLVGFKFFEEVFEKKLMPKFIFSSNFLIFLTVFVLIFTVLRNLPNASFNHIRP